MVAQNNITFQSTPTYSISSLFIIIHSPMINLSPKQVIQQYNRTATTSDVKLFHISVTQLFQDIAPNGASIFFFRSRSTLYNHAKRQITGEKTKPNPRNSLISDPLDKDFITKMQIHPLIQFGFFCKKKKRVLQSTGEKNLYTFKCYSCYRINLIHVNLSEFFILTVNKNKDNPQ